jgi:hypothetical protein
MGKHLGKYSLGRWRRSWEENIKMDLRVTCCEDRGSEVVGSDLQSESCPLSEYSMRNATIFSII